jgi:predicted dehydrogenase
MAEVMLKVKKKTIKAGIVGSGFAASIHARSMAGVTGVSVELAGVYSRSRDKREDFARRYETRAFETLESLVGAVDVVHVCTPPFVHEAVAVMALEQDKHAVVEKPLTGYFGDGTDSFNGETFPKQAAVDHAAGSIKRMLDAERGSKGRILYAENWVYAPAIQKEREIIEKTGAQVLWMHGEESHSGSHAVSYGDWRLSGGGSMIGKACHPLSAALYLKRVEGRARNGKPVRPVSVSARTHSLTRLPGYEDRKHLRSNYKDSEDFSAMHVVFDDGTVADIFASDIVMGGVHNWIEVAANNHRTICNINPNNAMQTYNPVDEYFKDVYVVEKTGTKQGWSSTSPGEDWFSGYAQEMEAFYRAAALGEPLESDSSLAADCIMAIYGAYVSAEQKGREVGIERL